LPLLAKARHLGVFATLSLVMAVVLAVVAGLRPAYSNTAPEWLNLAYLENEGRAWWLADPVPRLPASLRAAADFSVKPERHLQMAYAAPAGVARLPVPQASVMRRGDTVTLELKTDGEGIDLLVPAKARLREVTINGLAMPVSEGRLSITCGTPDCAAAHVVLKLGSAESFDLTLIAYTHGLPPQGDKLLKARPPWAVPVRAGDLTLRAAKIAIPAR